MNRELAAALERYFVQMVQRRRLEVDRAIAKGVNPEAVAGRIAAERVEYFLEKLREEMGNGK